MDSLLAFHEETEEFSVLGSPQPPLRQVGEFEVIRELGRGGMGVVLLARRGDEPPIALKLLRPDIVSPELLARFQREAAALARLDHPGIARLFQTGVAHLPQGARPWLAMEHIDGISLRDWARTEHSLGEKLELLARIADAVEHAHAQGVVHRDLKPENVLVRPDGSPVVLDFGVARLADSDVRATTVMTSLGMLVGTIRYMSPEQAEAQLGAIGPRSDVYTLGVVACELLEGRLPYEVPEDSVHRALVAVMTARMLPLTEVPAPARKPLEQLLRAALAKRPDQRLASAAALAEDLRRVASGRNPLARAPQEGRPDIQILRRLTPAILSTGGIVALLTLAFQQPPTPLDWASGLLQPKQMYRRIMLKCDSATVRIHYNTRALPRLREARVELEQALTLTRTLRWQPYHDEVRAHLRFRLGEARYLIAERMFDPAGYEAAAEIWLSVRELPQPPRRVPLPDTLGISAPDVIKPMATQPWAAAAMALSDLSRLRRTDHSLGRALQIRREGAQIFANRLGATSLLAVTGPQSDVDRLMLAGWLQGLGANTMLEGAHRSDSSAVRAGLAMVRRSSILLDAEKESSAEASRLNDLGCAFLWTGLFERADSLLDSATVNLRQARAIRVELPGYTSVVESSRELANALRAQAWSSGDPRRRRALLLEALAQLSLSQVSAVSLSPADEALLGFAAGEVLVDLGCVERDSSRFTQASAALAHARGQFSERAAPSLNVRANLQQIRIEAQRYAITGSRVHLVRCMQLIDRAALLGKEAGTPRWTGMSADAKRTMRQSPPRSYALDYPISTPF